MLWPEFWKRVPTGIEQHEYRTDVVLGSNVQEDIDALLESAGVLLPEQIVQEHTHRIHAQTFRPAEFFVDLLRIERLRLPHLKLVDGIRRNVVAANEPWLLLIPRVGFFLRPAWRGLGQQGRRKRKSEHSKQENGADGSHESHFRHAVVGF